MSNKNNRNIFSKVAKFSLIGVLTLSNFSTLAPAFSGVENVVSLNAEENVRPHFPKSDEATLHFRKLHQKYDAQFKADGDWATAAKGDYNLGQVNFARWLVKEGHAEELIPNSFWDPDRRSHQPMFESWRHLIETGEAINSSVSGTGHVGHPEWDTGAHKFWVRDIKPFYWNANIQEFVDHQTHWVENHYPQDDWDNHRDKIELGYHSPKDQGTNDEEKSSGETPRRGWVENIYQGWSLHWTIEQHIIGWLLDDNNADPNNDGGHRWNLLTPALQDAAVGRNRFGGSLFNATYAGAANSYAEEEYNNKIDTQIDEYLKDHQGELNIYTRGPIPSNPWSVVKFGFEPRSEKHEGDIVHLNGSDYRVTGQAQVGTLCWAENKCFKYIPVESAASEPVARVTTTPFGDQPDTNDFSMLPELTLGMINGVTQITPPMPGAVKTPQQVASEKVTHNRALSDIKLVTINNAIAELKTHLSHDNLNGANSQLDIIKQAAIDARRLVSETNLEATNAASESATQTAKVIESQAVLAESKVEEANKLIADYKVELAQKEQLKIENAGREHQAQIQARIESQARLDDLDNIKSQLIKAAEVMHESIIASENAKQLQLEQEKLNLAHNNENAGRDLQAQIQVKTEELARLEDLDNIKSQLINAAQVMSESIASDKANALSLEQQRLDLVNKNEIAGRDLQAQIQARTEEIAKLNDLENIKSELIKAAEVMRASIVGEKSNPLNLDKQRLELDHNKEIAGRDLQAQIQARTEDSARLSDLENIKSELIGTAHGVLANINVIENSKVQTNVLVNENNVNHGVVTSEVVTPQTQTKVEVITNLPNLDFIKSEFINLARNVQQSIASSVKAVTQVVSEVVKPVTTVAKPVTATPSNNVVTQRVISNPVIRNHVVTSRGTAIPTTRLVNNIRPSTNRRSRNIPKISVIAHLGIHSKTVGKGSFIVGNSFSVENSLVHTKGVAKIVSNNVRGKVIYDVVGIKPHNGYKIIAKRIGDQSRDKVVHVYLEKVVQPLIISGHYGRTKQSVGYGDFKLNSVTKVIKNNLHFSGNIKVVNKVINGKNQLFISGVNVEKGYKIDKIELMNWDAKKVAHIYIKKI